MIGRSAIGNPAIFYGLNSKKIKEIKFNKWLKLIKKLSPNIYFSQIKFQAINFTKNFEGASEMRRQLSLCKTEQEIKRIIDKRIK